VLVFTLRFGHKDFIERKSLLKVLGRAWTWLFYRFENVKISSVTDLSKSVKPGEKKHTS
jgi:hypothetical protein